MGQLKFSHFSGCDFTKQGLPYTDLFTICVTELDDNKDIFFILIVFCFYFYLFGGKYLFFILMFLYFLTSFFFFFQLFIGH